MREQIIDVYRFDGESFAKEERDGSEATRGDSTHTMTKYTPRREIHHITRLPFNHRASIDATRFRRLAPPPRPLSVRFFTRRRCLRTSPRSPRRRPRARRPTPKHHLRPAPSRLLRPRGFRRPRAAPTPPSAPLGGPAHLVLLVGAPHRLILRNKRNPGNAAVYFVPRGRRNAQTQWRGRGGPPTTVLKQQLRLDFFRYRPKWSGSRQQFI